MSYETSGIHIIATEAHDLGRVIRVLTEHPDKILQCYVSGRLVAWQRPGGGVAEFVLSEPADEDIVFLLAVDEAEAETDYWAKAFAENATSGNRIIAAIPANGTIYHVGDILKIFCGDEGQAQGDARVLEREMFASGRYVLGWGQGQWGSGGWGFSGSNSIGYGYNFGYGPWGFNCEVIEWVSEPKAPGDYPVKVIVEDAVGNESTAYETTVTLGTFARAARNLTVESYNSITDALTLNFELSPDDI